MAKANTKHHQNAWIAAIATVLSGLYIISEVILTVYAWLPTFIGREAAISLQNNNSALFSIPLFICVFGTPIAIIAGTIGIVFASKLRFSPTHKRWVWLLITINTIALVCILVTFVNMFVGGLNYIG